MSVPLLDPNRQNSVLDPAFTAAREGLSIPVFPELTPAERTEVVAALRSWAGGVASPVTG